MQLKHGKTVKIIAFFIVMVLSMAVMLSACNKDGTEAPDKPPYAPSDSEATNPSQTVGPEHYFTRAVEDGVDYIYFGSVADKVATGLLADILAVKVDGEEIIPDTDGTFEYGNSRFIVINAPNDGITRIFSDGSTVVAGKRYFVEYKPIKWRVLSEQDGKALLFADNVIGMSVFNEQNSFDSVTGLLKGTSIAANDFSASYIKRYLNGEYAKELFNDVEISHLIGGENAIKLLNYEQIGAFSLQVIDGAMTTVSPTDYLILSGIDVYLSSGGEQSYTGWWLSTEGKNKCFAMYVSAMGTYGENIVDSVGYSHGIRPVIELDING